MVTSSIWWKNSTEWYHSYDDCPVFALFFTTIERDGLAYTTYWWGCIDKQLEGKLIYFHFLVLFYSHALYMVCFSTLISVCVINLTRLKNHRALPWIIKKHLDGKLGELLLLHYITDTDVCHIFHYFYSSFKFYP